MILARVCGTVVTTISHPFFDCRKQLLIRAIKPDGSWAGTDYTVALDLVQAGVGDTVIAQDEGNSARQLTDSAPYGPVRAVIVGIVDQIDAPGE